MIKKTSTCLLLRFGFYSFYFLFFCFFCFLQILKLSLSPVVLKQVSVLMHASFNNQAVSFFSAKEKNSCNVVYVNKHFDFMQVCG